MYLMIQNPGVAPLEAYTLLGASGSRGIDAANGKFGSGNKLGITALLREGLSVTVYCGKERLVFGIRKALFESKPIERVTIAINGKKPTDLGWTLEWGASDWTDVGMGLRELVANAIDASIKGRGWAADLDDGDLAVELHETKRAKAGFTRVYVEASPEVEKYLEELPKRFLHFSDTSLDQDILFKAGRSLSGFDNAVIYRMGVFVCELGGASVYDYNFAAKDIEIDECRNSNEYSVRATIARRLRRATADELAPVMDAIGKRKPTMESKLDPYYLCSPYDTPSEEEKGEWQKAWKQTFGDAIMTDTEVRSLEHVQRKGYKAQIVDSNGWRDAMDRLGIRTPSAVLSPSEAAGSVHLGVSVDTFHRVSNIWDNLPNVATAGKELPPIAGFTGDGALNAFVEDGTLFIREDCASVDRAILEGFVAYTSGAPQLTAKFQDKAFEILEALV